MAQQSKHLSVTASEHEQIISCNTGGGGPELVEGRRGDAAVSVALVHFAGNCRVDVRHVEDGAVLVADAEVGGGGEQSLIVLAAPSAGERLDAIIQDATAAVAGKSVVFGGVASGASVALFHERCSDGGVLVCALTPREGAGQQLDAVVVSAASRAGVPLEVVASEAGSRPGAGDLWKVDVVRERRPGGASAAAPSRPPIEALMEATGQHGGLSGIVWSAGVDAATGELARPIRDLDGMDSYAGSLLTRTHLPPGSFLQAEVMDPQLAEENVKSGLAALAQEGREQRRAEAAAPPWRTTAGRWRGPPGARRWQARGPSPPAGSSSAAWPGRGGGTRSTGWTGTWRRARSGRRFRAGRSRASSPTGRCSGRRRGGGRGRRRWSSCTASRPSMPSAAAVDGYASRSTTHSLFKNTCIFSNDCLYKTVTTGNLSMTLCM